MCRFTILLSNYLCQCSLQHNNVFSNLNKYIWKLIKFVFFLYEYSNKNPNQSIETSILC